MSDEKNGDEGSAGAQESEASAAPPTIIGWSLRAFSGLIILVLFGYLLVKAISPQTALKLKVEPQWNERTQRSGELLVPVRITNDSTRTARDLTIELQPAGQSAIELDIMLMGPGEAMTYVLNLKKPAERLDYRVVSFRN